MTLNSCSGEFERLKAEVFSIALSVGNVVYISIEQLESDYIDLNGKPIPYADFNFPTLRDMLAAMFDKITLVDYGDQGTAVVPISNASTKHLERLIEKQNQKQKEPTRFGGVVPGLDNKEQNRTRNAARIFPVGTLPANHETRSRSEERQQGASTATTSASAANGVLENQNKRPTVDTAPFSVFERILTQPPSFAPAHNQQLPSMRKMRNCLATSTIRSKTCNMQIQKIPDFLLASGGGRPTYAVVAAQSRNAQIFKTEENRLKKVGNEYQSMHNLIASEDPAILSFEPSACARFKKQKIN